MRIRGLLPFTTLLTLLAADHPAQSADGASREFKSWQVLCGQTRTCTMRQFRSEGAISQFELKRQGGPDTPALITLSPNGSSLADATGDLSASLTVDDGQPFAFASSAVALSPDGWTVSLSGPIIANTLAGALKTGTVLHVAVTRGSVAVKDEIDLSGAAASLLFIDEFQMRIGHTDALSARGDKAPSPALPVRDILRFSDLPEPIRARLVEGGECAGTEEGMLDGNALAHQLAEDQTLYIMPCGMGGAYNMPYAAFLDSYGSLSTLAFPMMQDGAPSATNLAFNLSYDFGNRTLSAFFKGRGVGDCGTYSEWRLADNVAGPALVLVEEAFKDCPGEINETDPGAPQDWPKTWPLP